LPPLLAGREGTVEVAEQKRRDAPVGEAAIEIVHDAGLRLARPNVEGLQVHVDDRERAAVHVDHPDLCQAVEVERVPEKRLRRTRERPPHVPPDGETAEDGLPGEGAPEMHGGTAVRKRQVPLVPVHGLRRPRVPETGGQGIQLVHVRGPGPSKVDLLKGHDVGGRRSEIASGLVHVRVEQAVGPHHRLVVPHAGEITDVVGCHRERVRPRCVGLRRVGPHLRKLVVGQCPGARPEEHPSEAEDQPADDEPKNSKCSFHHSAVDRCVLDGAGTDRGLSPEGTF
jgi:hypothetical protein